MLKRNPTKAKTVKMRPITKSGIISKGRRMTRSAGDSLATKTSSSSESRIELAI